MAKPVAAVPARSTDNNESANHANHDPQYLRPTPPVLPHPPVLPQPAVVTGSTPASTSASTPAPTEYEQDLLRKLRQLTPEQRAKLRNMREDAGITGGLSSGPRTVRRNADGSADVTIRISPDAVPQLETWAEEAGKTFEDQVQEIAEVLFVGYLNGDWEAYAAHAAQTLAAQTAEHDKQMQKVNPPAIPAAAASV